MPAGPTVEDGELFASARAGDDAALTLLIERHKDGLLNYLTRLSGCRDTAEDLAQETFLRLIERSGGYVEEGKLRAYLYRIGTNLVRSARRRQARWRLVQPRLDPPLPTAPAAEARTERRELGALLTEALCRLPTRYRVPVILRDVEEWSYDEIATLLRVRPGTVKSRLHRGRRRLRELIEPDDQGGPP